MEGIGRQEQRARMLEDCKGHGCKSKYTEDLKDETRELINDCAPVQKKHIPKSSSSLFQHTPPHKVVTKSHQKDSTADLLRMLAESISSSHLPIPEPATFYGNPLRFSDWKISVL